MKVLFLSDGISSLGGVQRVTSVIANELSKNNDITIVSLYITTPSVYPISPSIKELSMDDIGVENHRNIFERGLKKVNNIVPILDVFNLKNIFYPLRNQKKIIKFINDNDFDVVIGVPGYWACMLGCIKNKVNSKLIGWQHNSFDAYFNTKNIYFWNQKRITARLIKKLDKYIVLNEFDQKRFKDEFGLNVDYIYNPKSFETDDISDLSNKRFIAAGRFEYQKGYDLLIKAYKKYSEIVDNPWPLYIYGDGSLKNEYLNLINNLNLKNDIFIKDFTDNIQKEFKESSCYLLSSRWEGFGLVVLEAMEIGIPVISFDLMAVKPLLTDDYNGLIVPACNIEKYAMAMKKISENDDLARKLANNGRIKANDFSIDKIGKIWAGKLNYL